MVLAVGSLRKKPSASNKNKVNGNKQDFKP
jgi:hypothetical protein